MKATIFTATSLDGKRATPDYSEDFLSDENWTEFAKHVNRAGCLIWGRKTADAVKKWPKKYMKKIKADIITLSKSKGKNHAKTPKEALRLASKLGHREAIISGGAKTIRSFLNANLIDEIIINIEPVIVGKGIPFASEGTKEKMLKLLSTKRLKKGIMQLKFKVSR